MKIGKPIASKSYHLLTPRIGIVKSKPPKTEIERINNGLIKLYKFSIERYVVKKNTNKPIMEKTTCLERIFSVSNSIDLTEVNNVNQEMILNKINCKRIYKFVPSGPNISNFSYLSFCYFPEFNWS